MSQSRNLLYAKNKAAEEAAKYSFKKRRARKRTWLIDFRQAVEWSCTEGYFELNIAKPTFDVIDDVVKVLQRLGYSIETYDKHLRVSWATQ